MARKTQKHKRPADLPGTIYLNKNRYWWKVRLPGETKIKARPLKPVGSRNKRTVGMTLWFVFSITANR